MRVSIEHEEKVAGLLRNVPQVEVSVTVEFSEEELAIIKGRNLGRLVIIERALNSHDADKLDASALVLKTREVALLLSGLVKGKPDRFVFDNPHDAKVYQQRLTTKLHDLKSFITENTQLAPKATFEI